jgi:hypothetical protein
MPSFESLLRQFQSQRGLFILGAGASAGTVKLGPEFLQTPGIDYVINGGSYPVEIPSHALLSQKIIRNAGNATMSQIFPGRILRPGTENFPLHELLNRMPDAFARFYLKHELARTRFAGTMLDAYYVFRRFHPSAILNYNLDGLMADHCGDIHEVFDPHGTVEPGYGSPSGAALVAAVREYDFTVAPDSFVMSVPESPADNRLVHQLLTATHIVPNYIAIIGYSFAGKEPDYDDFISLKFLISRYRRFPGNVYVMSPYPAELSDVIAHGIDSNRVYPIPTRWNVLAHAMVESLSGRRIGKSLNYSCEQLLDRYGHDKMAFPLLAI